MIPFLIAAGVAAAAITAGWLAWPTWAQRHPDTWPLWADVPRHCAQCGRAVPFDEVEHLTGVGKVQTRWMPQPFVCETHPRVAVWLCTPDCARRFQAKHVDIYHREGR